MDLDADMGCGQHATTCNTNTMTSYFLSNLELGHKICLAEVYKGLVPTVFDKCSEHIIFMFRQVPATCLQRSMSVWQLWNSLQIFLTLRAFDECHCRDYLCGFIWFRDWSLQRQSAWNYYVLDLLIVIICYIYRILDSFSTTSVMFIWRFGRMFISRNSRSFPFIFMPLCFPLLGLYSGYFWLVFCCASLPFLAGLLLCLSAFLPENFANVFCLENVFVGYPFYGSKKMSWLAFS